MKVSDYIIEKIANAGVGHIFGLTGGAVVHLFDSAQCSNRLRTVFCHHEQSAAFAAQAYSRITGRLGVAFVTTGPGGTNAITGLLAAWLDSIPTIFISGQTRLAHTSRGKGVRQLGTQEFDILSLVSPITKYSTMITDIKDIRRELEKALWMAQNGRPGPVWLDIPQDLHWGQIEPENIEGFDSNSIPSTSIVDYDLKIHECIEMLRQASRPLVLVGQGVRLANAEESIRKFVKAWNLPFVTTWNATDLLPHSLPLGVGRPGVFGQRGANLAVQNCDFLLAVGSHLCVALTGTIFDAFARDAKKVIVDVDSIEIEHRTVPIEMGITCNAKTFLDQSLKIMKDENSPCIDAWRNKCLEYRNRYNEVPVSWYHPDSKINPYVFIDVLNEKLTSHDIVVIDGGGTVNQIAFQTLKVKDGQRIIISGGVCSMGSGLPESVGAAFAGGKGNVILLCGDGSFQLNVQELQTIVHHELNVKIFVLCNGGYLSIRNTQDSFLEGRHVGSSCEGGMSLPDICKVAEAYGLPTLRTKKQSEIAKCISWAFEQQGPVLIALDIPQNQSIEPRQGFTMRADGSFAALPLEDMFPFIERKEFQNTMIVEKWKDEGMSA